MTMRILDWQFVSEWQSLWRYVEFDPEYGAYIVWFGFAFWQFRIAKREKP